MQRNSAWYGLTVAGLVMTVLPACVNRPLPSFVSLENPFQRDKVNEDSFGPLPVEQVEMLRRLANEAEGLDLGRQERVSQDLARRVSSEADPHLRLEIVKTLGTFSTTAASQGLRTALSDGDADVRIAACQALGRRENGEAVQMLAGVLGSDTEIDVRLTAVRELGRFQSTAALRALGSALDETDPALRYRVVEALRKSSPHDYGGDIAAWKRYSLGENYSPSPPPTIAERFRQLF